MRILLAVDAPSSHLFPLPNGWADRGHTVDVVMDAPDGRFGHAREHEHPGVRLLTLSTGGSIVDAVSGRPTDTRLGELVRSADAIVVGGYATHVARRVLLIPRAEGARRVLLAERPFPRSRGPRRWARDRWARWAVSRVDAVWSMSAAGDRAFAHLGRAPEARIPYPYQHFPRGSQNLRLQPWSVDRSLRILVIGKLTAGKRPSSAVEVTRMLSEKGIDVETAFAGDGALRAELEAATQGLPIRFLGHVQPPVVVDLIESSSLLLHPSPYEGWGMVVIEAAGRGVPVVATTGCDAATELANHTRLVRATDGSTDAMAAAIEEVLATFRADPVSCARELVEAVDQVCGADRVVERALGMLDQAGARHG